MKHIIYTGTLVLASLMTGEAIAACVASTFPDDTWIRVESLEAELSDKTVCSLAGQGTQEEHHGGSGGALYDFSCGPSGFPATGLGTACEKPESDPRSLIGSWNILNNSSLSATVSYTYSTHGGATSGPFSVYKNTTNSNYDFCNGSTSVGIFTLAGTLVNTRVCPAP